MSRARWRRRRKLRETIKAGHLKRPRLPLKFRRQWRSTLFSAERFDSGLRLFYPDSSFPSYDSYDSPLLARMTKLVEEHYWS